MFFVVSHGLTRGARAALAANAGILTANMMYFALSALGLGAVLLASPQVFTALKYAGAVYLVYLGVQTMRGAGLSLAATNSAAERDGARRIWWRATALQASNPKSLIFFTALLPQFLDVSRPLLFQIFVLGVTSLVIEFVILGAYGYLATAASRLSAQPRFRLITNRVSGALLIVAGPGLLLA